jgi:hypothetical protein
VVEEALEALVSLPALRGASLSRGFSATAEEMARKIAKSKHTVGKQNLLRADYRESNCQTGRGGGNTCWMGDSGCHSNVHALRQCVGRLSSLYKRFRAAQRQRTVWRAQDFARLTVFFP